MLSNKWPWWSSVLIVSTWLMEVTYSAEDYNVLHKDGSYEFGYKNPDSFHHSKANRNNVVGGQFGSRSPSTGKLDVTSYSAGPRGFRPRGKNIARKYDLSQSGPRPIGSRDDPYYDPNEDPSYNFAFRTRTYSRQEAANRLGDVAGRYSYLDDVGERHNVEFIAGKNTGYHVKSLYPDSNPRVYDPLYINDPGRPIPRGRTSIQRGLDGSYSFISAGADQRRTETSDRNNYVRGSYTYLDDKGVQHSVHYIAGPEIGYRVLKNVKAPHFPSFKPFSRPAIVPPDLYELPDRSVEDVFDAAASGHAKPSGGGVSGTRPDKNKRPTYGGSSGGGKGPNEIYGGSDTSFDSGDAFNKPFGTKPPAFGRPFPTKPSFGSDDDSTAFGGASSEEFDSGGFKKPFGAKPPITSGFGGQFSTEIPFDLEDFKRPFSTKQPLGSDGLGEGSYKPTYDDDVAKEFGDLFGEAGVSKRPLGTTVSPVGPSGGGSYRPRPGDSSISDDGSYKPSGDDGSYRPGLSGYRPPFGGRPSETMNTASSSNEPSGTGVISGIGQAGDFGIFSTSRPLGDKESAVHIGVSHGGGTVHAGAQAGDSYYSSKGTIVTNVGDKLFSVPPGASVRAHVQAIDLLSVGTKPSPSEQLKAESEIINDALDSGSSKDSRVVATTINSTET